MCFEQDENKNIIKDVLYDIVFFKVSKIISESITKKENIGLNNKAINYWNISDITDNTRTYVLQRDNNECQICKNKENLHIHHIIKRSNGGSHNEDNLITLCASCHRHIEVGDIELAINGCLKNALKHYDLYEYEPCITFNKIYNQLLNISKLLLDGDINNANSQLNFLIDKIDEHLH